MSKQKDKRKPVVGAEGVEDRRFAMLLDWLKGLKGVNPANVHPATDDASFRRYFRVEAQQGSLIVMDAPPELEDSKPFIRTAGYLRDMGLHVPEILEADLEKGFLLLTDLGSTHYYDVLRADPDQTRTLYSDALGALVLLQTRGTSYQSALPPYDEELLRLELSIFREWLCQTHLAVSFSEKDEARWQDVCNLLVRNALEQPHVFVHRDFHSRNLMRTAQNNPGILDFQGALEGPLTYDLVSLLKDCYVQLPADQIQDCTLNFYRRLATSIRREIDEDRFLRYFDLMGTQRHLKAAGIFARLKHRDGKPHYLRDVPRTLGYIVELHEEYPELGWLIEFVETKCIPALEVVE